MIQELHSGATNLAYQAMLELRPNIGPESVFVDHVDKVLRPEGYRLVGFFVEADVNAVAVAGFRVFHMLAWGHALYCDDLGTRFEHRRQGYAGQLMRSSTRASGFTSMSSTSIRGSVRTGLMPTACTSTSGCGSRRSTSRARFDLYPLSPQGRGLGRGA